MRFVSVDGPYSEAGPWSDWEEYPVWYVAVCDEDGEPVGKTYTCRSRDRALDLGEMMARDRRLELVNEAGFA